VPCSCHAHVYLTKVDESTCSWASHADSARVLAPCTSIDLMIANETGFKSQFRTCTSWGGACEVEPRCQRKASDNSATAFGKGPNYDIDTNSPFHVQYQFWVDEDADGNRGSLTDIK